MIKEELASLNDGISLPRSKRPDAQKKSFDALPKFAQSLKHNQNAEDSEEGIEDVPPEELETVHAFRKRHGIRSIRLKGFNSNHRAAMNAADEMQSNEEFKNDPDFDKIYANVITAVSLPPGREAESERMLADAVKDFEARKEEARYTKMRALEERKRHRALLIRQNRR